MGAPQALPSLVVGGPFHRLMGRARMLGPDRLPRPRAALAVGVAGWGIGALLALAQYVRAGDPALLGYFLDASPYAHALIALVALIAIERTADRRLGALIDYPLSRSLVSGEAATRYRAAVSRADVRSGSALAEAPMLVVAVVVCAWAAGLEPAAGQPAWSRLGTGYTWAGAWLQYAVGVPLVFLVLRWLYRFCIWSLLLATLAGLPLALVPTHPDRAAGLGFVGAYPTLFAGLVVALGAAVGAELFNASVHRAARPDEIVGAVAIWVAIVLATFVGPILVFAPKLLAVRDAALLEVGSVAVAANRAVADPAMRAGAVEAAKATEDLNKLYDRVAAIQPVPVSRATVTQLLTIALLPMLPALATHVPLTRLLGLVVGGVG